MALKINRKVQYVLRGIGIVLLLILILGMVKILVWEHDYYGNKGSEERAPADVAITSMATIFNPSTKKPTDQEFSEYQVEADTPRFIDIERLDIHAIVERSVVETAGVLPLPENIHNAAWYSGSGKPGQNNYIIISGIHSFNNKNGLFANLDSLEQGDKIIIETGSGNKYTYAVKEITMISDGDAERQLPYMQRRIDDQETLSLITAKSNESGEYNSFVMLRAVLANTESKDN